MRVSTFMTEDPFTIGSDASLAEALLLMDEHDVRHLPVVDAGTLVGILSNRDALATPSGAVSDVMHTRIVTVEPDVTTWTAFPLASRRSTPRISTSPDPHLSPSAGSVSGS